MRHGDRATYTFGRCRCQPCRQANSAYQRQIYRDRHRPDGHGSRTTDATEAAAHIAMLRRHGVGLEQIERISGIARSTIVAITNGHRHRVRATTAIALHTVTPADRAPGRWGPERRHRRSAA